MGCITALIIHGCLSLLVVTSHTSEVITEDYCTSETFEPECPEGNVLFIESAIYGRMHECRCISSDYGVGCQADVTAHLADICSGRKRCSVVVGTLDTIAQPCDKDLRLFLQASHRCIHVKYAKPCRHGEKKTRLLQSRGFIAPYSDSSYMSHLSELCAWEIHGQPGQKINITVNNLFTPGREQAMHSSTGPCPIRVTITEKNVLPTGNVKNTYDLCQEMNMPKVLYTSYSNVISVQVPYNARSTSVVEKLLKYEVYGCPNIEPSRGSHVKRDGDNIAIVCNATMETWYLTCKDGQWVGEPGNCTVLTQSVAPPSQRGQIRHGITLAVIVGVALGTFMGACMLCMVYVARKSKKRGRGDQHQYSTDIQYEPGTHSGTITATATLTTADRNLHIQSRNSCPQQSAAHHNQLPAVLCHAKTHPDSGLTEYTHVWGMPPSNSCTTERQYSASTFNPHTYERNNSCVPLQNYDSSANVLALHQQHKAPVNGGGGIVSDITGGSGAISSSAGAGALIGGGGGTITATAAVTATKGSSCILNNSNIGNKNNSSKFDLTKPASNSISGANLKNATNGSHLLDDFKSSVNNKSNFFCELHGNV